MTATTETTTGEALRLLHPRGEVYEVRILGKVNGVVSGYFDDPEFAAAAIAKYDGVAEGIYHTVNPVNPMLLSRAPNRFRENVASGGCTTDSDVERRTVLPIDVDPERPAKTSATDDELKAAFRVLRAVKAHLEDDLGWPAGTTVMSGNGGHLYYPVDLPNDSDSRDLVKRILAKLAKDFDEKGVAHVDKSVWNASRIMKVPGTVAAKGTESADRPHRRSKVLRATDEGVCVPLSALEALAGPAPTKTAKGTQASGNGLAAWSVEQVEERLASWGLSWRNVKNEDDRTVWVLRACPACGDEGGKAFVQRKNDGVLSAACLHDSCAFDSWAYLRAMFEPGYADRRDLTPVQPSQAQKPENVYKKSVEKQHPKQQEKEQKEGVCTDRREVPKPTPLGAAAYHGPIGAFVEAWDRTPRPTRPPCSRPRWWDTVP